MKLLFKACPDIVWPLVVLGLLGVLLLSRAGHAEERDFDYHTRLQPGDYLLQSHDPIRDPVFDGYKTVDLGVNLGVGADCGRMDFKGTLQSTLKNIFDAKYFGNLGQTIIASSPMLLTCYFSPTWCAILKHSQVSAQWLSQMRLDQCSLVDKYVDSRTEDFYQERQTCIHKAIEKNGGDLENAMDTCHGGGLWNQNLGNWAGSRYGDRVASNKLIEASAKWAGLDGENAQSAVGLVKSLVGDTVISKGNISVEYGPGRSSALSPRGHLQALEKSAFQSLCLDVVAKAAASNDPEGELSRALTNSGLNAAAANGDGPYIDRQTLRALLLMPPNEREMACRKLSDGMALTVFSNDMNRSLDILTTLEQNPNLPENRRTEMEKKRQSLKESVDLTLALQRSRNEPINTVLSEVNLQGRRLSDAMVQDELKSSESESTNHRASSSLTDCADGFMCGEE